MNKKTFNSIMRKHQCTGLEKIILMCIATHTNQQTNTAQVSSRELREQAGITHPSLFKILASLKRKSLISITHAKRRQNVYTLNLTDEV